MSQIESPCGCPHAAAAALQRTVSQVSVSCGTPQRQLPATMQLSTQPADFVKTAAPPLHRCPSTRATCSGRRGRRRRGSCTRSTRRRCWRCTTSTRTSSTPAAARSLRSSPDSRVQAPTSRCAETGSCRCGEGLSTAARTALFAGGGSSLEAAAASMRILAFLTLGITQKRPCCTGAQDHSGKYLHLGCL